MAIALRNVAMPVRRSRSATLGLEKMFMGNSLKNRPGMGSYAAPRYNEA
jgi:hypothetical protein